MDKISCGGFYLGEGLELDGKVLKAAGGGGGGMVVHIEFPFDGSPTGDKTPTEVAEALKNGTNVMAVCTDEEEGKTYYCNTAFDLNANKVCLWRINDDGTIYVQYDGALGTNEWGWF